jgi:hypothetical protein
MVAVAGEKKEFGMDALRMQELVWEWQGVDLNDAAAKRLSAMSVSVRDALDVVAGQSLFDTEPAHFERALRAMASDD